MNDQEYRALLVILQRAPVSPAEMLWLNALLARLRPEAQQPAPTHERLNDAHLD